ncbi:MAG: hypothetical protein WA191_06985 [Telluria sp.]
MTPTEAILLHAHAMRAAALEAAMLKAQLGARLLADVPAVKPVERAA